MKSSSFRAFTLGLSACTLATAASAVTPAVKAPTTKPAANKAAATKPAPASAAPTATAPATAAKPAATLQPTSVSSDTHPGALIADFNGPVATGVLASAPFVPYQPAGGVASGAELSVENGALVLRNAYAGSFSVDTKTPAFDAAKLAHLYFDYKLSPDVKVNIFFRSKGVYHCAVFSGPQRVRPGGILMGAIADVKADGQWHRAHVPLRDWLRKLYPASDTLPVDEILIGNWDNAGYLMAGFGGNNAGATWSLDNWALLPTGGVEANFAIANAPKPGSWSIDGKALPLNATGLVSAKPGEGPHILRVTGKNGEAAAYPFFTAATGPSVGEAILSENEIALQIKAPGGLDLTNLSLTVGDKAFDRNSPYLVWDGANDTLRLDAARAGLSWKDTEAVSYKVSGIKDLQGRTAADKAGSLNADFSKASTRPRSPHYRFASGSNSLNGGDFEDGIDGWSNAESGGTIIERDDTTAAAGSSSLRLTCPGNAVPFRAWIRREGFDAAQYPVITFFYKVPGNLRVDFLLGYDGVSYSIHFTDKDAAYKRIGEVPNIIADNQWHRGQIDLRSILQGIKPGQDTYKVDWLAIGDTGWLGNARNTQYWFDDFYFVPRAIAPGKLELTLEDTSGIKAVAWDRSTSPDRVPATEANSAGNSIEITDGGLSWLNARVQNGAGHWSEPVHLPVVIDTK